MRLNGPRVTSSHTHSGLELAGQPVMQCSHAGVITEVERAISRLRSRIDSGAIRIVDVLRLVCAPPLHDEGRDLPFKPGISSGHTAQRVAISRKSGDQLRQMNQPQLMPLRVSDTRRTYQSHHDIKIASELSLIRFAPPGWQTESAGRILPCQTSAFNLRSSERPTVPMSS